MGRIIPTCDYPTMNYPNCAGATPSGPSIA
ncbi:hypothetical protein [Escherichia phage UPEC06]|nr:hypothetical protein [Escherichia phage UPEC06]QUL77442.1 hypothetical protein [Escherichia phage UPEC06]